MPGDINSKDDELQRIRRNLEKLRDEIFSLKLLQVDISEIAALNEKIDTLSSKILEQINQLMNRDIHEIKSSLNDLKKDLTKINTQLRVIQKEIQNTKSLLVELLMSNSLEITRKIDEIKEEITKKKDKK
ncbi:MAG: hypothetical protein J7L07_03765 [Candidatus Odinarchaeota archaeon]|nr:hypothetical protein [Candidatus Odinarchaeota archaeon]